MEHDDDRLPRTCSRQVPASTQTVTVGAGAPATSDFSFTAAQLKAENVEGGALRALPALEFPMLGMHH